MTARALAVLGFVCILAACRRSPSDDVAARRTSSATPSVAEPPVASFSLPPEHAVLGFGDTVRGESIYRLGTELVDQSGKKQKLDMFAGKIVLISMFYASCPHACPTLISHVKEIDAELSPAHRQDVRILLVSIDPDNDTPESLRGVVDRHKLDASRWRLTTTPEDGVREIAAVLGVKYRQADGTFNHSSVITLLDREGKIDMRVDGMSDSRAVTAARIRELIARK